jgi:hypothetical protein
MDGIAQYDPAQPRAADAAGIAPDPAALRARLKHRVPPTSGSSSSNADYNNVLNTARRLAELERQRAQDAAYIRTLEHARATLQRDAQTAASTAAAAARARVEAEAEVGRRKGALLRAEAEGAVAAVGRERARAECAEERARGLERLLEEAGERVLVLEGVVEGERRRREEWERGLEALALGGGVV